VPTYTAIHPQRLDRLAAAAGGAGGSKSSISNGASRPADAVGNAFCVAAAQSSTVALRRSTNWSLPIDWVHAWLVAGLCDRL
jgi:hypothetical protein